MPLEIQKMLVMILLNRTADHRDWLLLKSNKLTEDYNERLILVEQEIEFLKNLIKDINNEIT